MCVVTMCTCTAACLVLLLFLLTFLLQSKCHILCLLLFRDVMHLGTSPCAAREGVWGFVPAWVDLHRRAACVKLCQMKAFLFGKP